MSVASAPKEIEPASAIAPPGSFSLTSLWALYALTLRQHRHGKRWMVMAVLMLLPAALVILVRSTAHNVPSISLEFIFAFMLIPQALLPLVALIYGSGIIQDEVEEQTITYLLIRPISKWQLYIVKLLATLTVAVFLTVIFTTLTYIAVYAGATDHVENVPLRCLEASSIHALAVIAYCCIFGLISLFTRRTLVVGILYIVIFEGLFANLAFGIRLITVIYYARIIAYRTLPFVISTPDGRENFAADAWQLDIRTDPNLLEHPQIRACLIVLLVGSAVCAALTAMLCARREFHVKTPEKA
ncbi:MAG TPA: ABC transporter permease subunit [Tepidisphaeraceae bacterium]|jgi:ABC-2 type transport system permease protein